MDSSPAKLTPARIWSAVALVMLTIGFYQPPLPGWNVNSQFGLTVALAEHGTFRIDDYHRDLIETGDKALYNGHYYSDKSALTPMLAVPVCWLWLQLDKSEGKTRFDRARYWTNWFTNGPLACALVVMLALALVRHGVDETRAWLAALLWFAATPLLGYSIIFYQYTSACAMLLGAFTCLRLHDPSGDAPPPRRLFFAGLLAGLAAWALQTLAIHALVLTLLLMTRVPARQWWRLWPWALGGIAGVAGHFIYTWMIFDTLGTPYQYESDKFFRESMARGLMGATRPRASVAWAVTFSPGYGLFFWFPLALAGLLGSVYAVLRRAVPTPLRAESCAALAVFALLLLYNSAYFLWWGGWAYAPRHLIPALPLLALGLIPILKSPRRWLRDGMLVLGLASAVINALAIALNPQLKEVLNYFLADPWKLPFPTAPMWTLLRYVFVERFMLFNWGTKIGMYGPASVTPLLAAWLAGGLMLARAGRKKPAA